MATKKHGLRGAMLLSIAWVMAIAVPASADEGGDGPTPTVYALVDGKGKAAGTETLRVVRQADGAVFASGEVKLGPKGKKKLIRTHVQRKSDGAIARYQRTEGGLKGTGLRIFEFEGRTRTAPVNAPGKPADLAGPITHPLWDKGLWHLLALWPWPKRCERGMALEVYDVTKQAARAVTLDCEGAGTVLNPDKAQVATRRFKVTGLLGEALVAHVAEGGKLLGVKGATQEMLINKWGWDTAVTVVGDGDEADVDEEEAEIKERGAGP